jgi:hypothetical protein
MPAEEKRSYRLKRAAAKVVGSIPAGGTLRLCFGRLEFCDLPRAIPYLYVVAVYEHFGARYGGFVVFASKLYATENVAVATD